MGWFGSLMGVLAGLSEAVGLEIFGTVVSVV